jgi:tetratricopeptide (TPR) repeat protein
MNIANSLRAEFSLEEQRALERPPTSSPEAYDLYLQALAVAGTAPTGAIDLLDRAVSLDPAFAGAYSLRAQVRSLQLGNNVLVDAVAPAEREAVELRVREDAQKALERNPADSRARAVLADLDVRYGYWSRVPVFEDIDFSNYPPAILWVHAWSGNVERALEVSERWARLDPTSGFAHMNLGVIYAYADDRAASTRSMRRALDLAPTNTLARAFLAYNAVAVGDSESALAELQRLERLLGDNPPTAFLPEIAYAYSRIGRTEDAKRLVTRINAIGTERDLGHGARALAYLAVGDEAHALDELELAAAKTRNHESDVSGVTLMNLRMNFLNDPLISTPRFSEVLERIRGD